MHFYHVHHLVGRAASNGLSACLGCPGLKNNFQDDRSGNLWPLETLTPCKLAAVPQCSDLGELS